MSDHFNKLSPDEAERLAYLIEECGEVLHMAGKTLRHGYNSRNPVTNGPVNRVLLQEEIVDLLRAVSMMGIANDINLPQVLSDLMKNPVNKKYMHHQELREGGISDITRLHDA